MALSREEILNAIGELTVLDLAQLVKDFEEKFGVSAAYNWSGDSLRIVDSALASQDVYWKARKQIDLQAHYDISGEWRALFSIGNVTNSPLVSVTGPGRNLLKDTFSLGRTYWLGLTYTPKKL